MSTIPSSELVSVTPSVLAAGGAGIQTIGLVLDSSTRVPLGTVAQFSSALAVEDYFGPGTIASGAAVYFTGFENADQTPGLLLIAQYNQTAVSAYLRGGNISALTLSQLQAISGSLDVVFDGYARNAASVNLSGASSFTAAASTIQTALNAADPTEETVTASIGATFTGNQSSTNLTTTSTVGLISIGDTISGTGVASGTKIVSQTSGTPGGNGVYVTSLSGTASSASCVASSNVLDVTVGAGIMVGHYVTGAGVVSAPITALGTGSGGAGTYVISGSPQQVASESMTLTATPITVTYDSVSGAFVLTSGITGSPSTAAFATGTIAASLLLTSATGAVLSQGAAAAVPATFMNALIQVNQDWVAFKTGFDPDTLGNTGNTVKQAFAAWKNTALGGNRFAYVCQDHDITPTETVPATSSLGYILANNGDSGTILIYEPSTGGPYYTSWFVLGIVASIDFQEPNGRVTFAYKAQAGLIATVSDPTSAVNLGGNPQTVGSDGNGYNFYGAYATAGQNNTWFQRGFITGPYEWADSYINQIWLNNQLQVALLTAFGNSKSIPFNSAGATIIEQALASPIANGLSFGAYGPGQISASQAQQINAASGNSNAANTVQTQGWYLQVVPASATLKAARGPQQVNFWYNDNGSVQVINLNSIALN